MVDKRGELEIAAAMSASEGYSLTGTHLSIFAIDHGPNNDHDRPVSQAFRDHVHEVGKILETGSIHDGVGQKIDINGADKISVLERWGKRLTNWRSLTNLPASRAPAGM